MYADHGTAPPALDPRREAWEIFLDRLELDVIRVERALGTETLVLDLDEWQVPDDPGPLPPDLQERARSIQARQQALLADFARRMRGTRRQQAVTDRLARISTRGAGNPVYIDLTA